MTTLDAADLVVIAGRTLGIGTDAALTQIDITAAQTALTEGLPAGHPAGRALTDRAAAAAACTELVQALLRHPPFPGHHQRVAVAAGLQLLALNGWQANLDPPAAAVVVESLASGRLSPAAATAWLSPRLFPSPMPRTKEGPVRALQRGLQSVLPFPGPGAAGMVAGGRMIARFTGRAAASIGLAQQEARRLGHGHIDPEHILLGLIRQGEGVAITALERLGISLELLRQQVEESIGHGQGAPAGPIRPSRPRGQKVLNSALPEALTRGRTDRHGCIYMGTGHLLLAQFHDGGAAAQALARLGAGESEVRGAITAILGESEPLPAQPHGTRGHVVRAGRNKRL